MAKAYLAVRAEVPEADRAKFDHWYETDHLPWARRVFKAKRAWRCWSRTKSGATPAPNDGSSSGFGLVQAGSQCGPALRITCFQQDSCWT